jgi:hypothetical protein
MAILTDKAAGICPACGETVKIDEPDGPVWTCPADLNRRNPYWEPSRVSSSRRRAMRRAGIYSLCGEDTGDGCYDRMPLHSTCYEAGDY